MITRPQLSEIGHTIKPHGINGEISATINGEIDLMSLKCLVMDIDGIFVPFFISAMRPRGTEAVLISIDGIDNEIEAKRLCGKTVYGLKEDCDTFNPNDNNDEDGFYAEDLIGYNVIVDNANILGEITDIDTSTENVLFIINANEKKIFIPVVDEFIEEIDTENHTINMSLPEGLIEMQ